jgi:hypothetical protein
MLPLKKTHLSKSKAFTEREASDYQVYVAANAAQGCDWEVQKGAMRHPPQ